MGRKKDEILIKLIDISHRIAPRGIHVLRLFVYNRCDSICLPTFFYLCFESLIRSIRGLNNKFFQLWKKKRVGKIRISHFVQLQNDFSFVTYLARVQLSISVIIKHRFVQSPPLKSSCLFKIQVTMLHDDLFSRFL